MDAWDGYPAARRRLLRSFVDRGVRNPVVLPYVRRPGAPVTTAATFALTDLERGLERAGQSASSSSRVASSR